MSDLTKVLYGDEYAAKQEAFDKRLLEIEQKYLHWFKQRPHPYREDDHDRLSMHTMEQTKQGQHIFGFAPDSELPADVKNECIAAFNDIWNS